jgi:hypothetical protein
MRPTTCKSGTLQPGSWMGVLWRMEGREFQLDFLDPKFTTFPNLFHYLKRHKFRQDTRNLIKNPNPNPTHNKRAFSPRGIFLVLSTSSKHSAPKRLLISFILLIFWFCERKFNPCPIWNSRGFTHFPSPITKRVKRQWRPLTLLGRHREISYRWIHVDTRYVLTSAQPGLFKTSHTNALDDLKPIHLNVRPVCQETWSSRLPLISSLISNMIMYTSIGTTSHRGGIQRKQSQVNKQ